MNSVPGIGIIYILLRVLILTESLTVKKKFLYLALAMASLSTQWASAAYQSVVVHRRDGSALQIGLDRAVTAKISDGALVFTSSLGYVSLPADEVWHWAFSTAEAPGDVWSGIEDAAAGEAAIICSDGRLELRGLPEGTGTSLYALDGRLVAASDAAADGTCLFDTASLPCGIYLLTYGNHSVKIMLGR